MTVTWTTKRAEKLTAYLDSHHIPSGLGTKEAACSLAAINLAIDGRLTDEIPDCMSEVIGRWVIRVQDAMPDQIRNSPGWKAALVLSAGSGRGREQERAAMILDWMWATVLPSLQPAAGRRGFGKEWKAMCDQRTSAATASAASATAWESFDPAGLLLRLAAL